MITESYQGEVVVRVRDENDKRQVLKFKGYPYCYVDDVDAEFIDDGRVEHGYKGVFGEKLAKVTMATTRGIRELNATGATWEANVSFTNQVLAERVKRGEEPIPSYNHRIWYLDGEWKIESGEITLLTVFDSYTENLYTWLWHPDVKAGKHKSLGEYTYDTPIMAFDDERSLLQHFIKFMGQQDPDIITGWYVTGADIKQIVKRCAKVNVAARFMSPNQRLRYEFGDWDQPIVGRNCIDLRLAFPKLYELKNGKLPNYKLDDVAWEALGEKKTELPDGHDTYYSDIALYTEYNRQDVALLPRLNNLVNAIDYFIAVQHIAQCEIRSTPHVTQVFTNLTLCDPEVDFQIPSKPMFPKEEYDGAIVMDGEKGVYNNIGIFDVKAMYHSNAALHNISWDTISPDGVDCGNGIKFDKSKKGLLVRQMDRMTELRDHYKRLMAEATTDEERVRYDALQYATKSLVASMYGIAGDSKYGLYHPDIASAITFTSRATLMKLRDVAEDMGHPVVYGHTDSVMCHVESPEHGEASVVEMNKRMHPIIVQFEKWSSSFLLMEKNRYAGLVSWTDGEAHEPKRYVKGIEMKQSRMPTIMKESMGMTIDAVLRGEDGSEITSKISGLIGDIVGGNIDPALMCMKGKLKQDLSKYKSISGMAAGAKWANMKLGKGYVGGDYFMVAIDPKGNYMAFDDPSEIEGIGEIGYKLMAERFIVKKIEPYFKVAGWDMTEVYRALEGKSNVMWI